jgi:hypothetical protein
MSTRTQRASWAGLDLTKIFTVLEQRKDNRLFYLLIYLILFFSHIIRRF